MASVPESDLVILGSADETLDLDELRAAEHLHRQARDRHLDCVEHLVLADRFDAS